MEELPPELIEMIVLNLGGHEFVNLRRTCKRIKTVIDSMEMMLKPSLWYRFTYTDFPKPCIESLMPWLKEGKDSLEEETFIWKKAYSCLLDSKIRPSCFTHKEMFLPVFPDVISSYFIGQQLLVATAPKGKSCLGFPNKVMNSSSILPITSLRYHNNRTDVPFASCEIEEDDMNNPLITYKPLNIGDQDSKPVLFCREIAKSIFGGRIEMVNSFVDIRHFLTGNPKRRVESELIGYITSKMNISHVCSEDFHQFYELGMKGIVYKDNLFICQQWQGDSCNDPLNFVCSHILLPNSMDLFCAIGNMIIFRFVGQRSISTSMLQSDIDGKVELSPFQDLFLPDAKGSCLEFIVGFDVAGSLFAAVTQAGRVYLSCLGTINHQCLQNNLFPAFLVTNNAYDTIDRLTIDINEGVTIAVSGKTHGLTLFFINPT